MVALTAQQNLLDADFQAHSEVIDLLKNRFISQSPLTFRRVSIAIHSGVLVLSGTVDSYLDKALAVQIVRRNVFDLDVADELRVNPAIRGSIESLNRLSHQFQ